jgi:hypothetical protein
MRVIPVDKPPGAAGHLAKPRGFWQRLAQTLDDYLAERTKRAVPDATFRRSRHEIDRCRRLMLKGALSPAHALTHARVAYPRRVASVGRPS